jgi:Tfp pilus assembly protein PilO
MKQSSKRLFSILIALAFVMAALVMFFDLVQPEYSNMMMSKENLAAGEALLQSENQSVSQAQKIIAEYQSQGALEGNVSLAVPTTEDIPGALAQLYGLAANNGISVQSISVSAPTIQPQTTMATTTDIVKPIGTISFQVTAEGAYEGLENFVSGLETNVRIFDLKGVTIVPAAVSAGKDGVATSEDYFNYTMTIDTYYQTN